MYDISKHFAHLANANGTLGGLAYSLKAPLVLSHPTYRGTICSCCGSLFAPVASYHVRLFNDGNAYCMSSLGLRLFPGTIINEFVLDAGYESRDDIMLLDGSALSMLYYHTYKNLTQWPQVLPAPEQSSGWQDDDDTPIILKQYTGPKMVFVYFGAFMEKDHSADFYAERGYGDRKKCEAAATFFKDKFSLLIPLLEKGQPLFFILTDQQLIYFNQHIKKYGLENDIIYQRDRICNLNDQPANNPRLNVRVLQRKV